MNRVHRWLCRSALWKAALERRLLPWVLDELKAAMNRSQVIHKIKERCTDSHNYTLLVADIRYLGPKTYIGFGEGAYNYTLSLKTSGYADPSSVKRAQGLSTNTYNAFLSEIYAEGDEGRLFEPFVVSEGSELVQELTAYWWEDNPRRSRRATLLPPLLGGALALLSGVVAAWWALRRRSAGKKSRHSPSG